MFIQSHKIPNYRFQKEKPMNQMYSILTAIVVLVIVAIIGCSKGDKPSMDDGEEEAGTELALDATYDKVRNGARLILNYDAQSNSFKGTVENTTDETLKQVRVEVHLSNGKEIGPTTPTDLEPGEKKPVELTATSKDFNGWTAHPEVGEGEHSNGEHDGEGGEEHDGEGENEHE